MNATPAQMEMKEIAKQWNLDNFDFYMNLLLDPYNVDVYKRFISKL